MNRYVNDNEALHNISKGDMQAYRYLFDNHFADLCNFILIYLHDRRLAEEIALDIFIFIWEKREELQIKTSFKNFLFGVAKNKAISHYRKEQKKLLTDFKIEDINLFDPESSQKILENSELQQIISGAVENLPQKSRLVYQMAWEQNLPYKEIAQRLGLSIKTVENHVGIALRKLREELKPYYEQIFIFWIISNFL